MFDDIRPYNDAETSEALKRASNNPLMERISAFLFPGKDPDILRNTLNTITGVDDFQTRVMYPAVRSIISKTTKGLSYEGLEHFKSGKCFLLLSNHRDIVLDPAFIQYILKDNRLRLTDIAIGDNLISDPFIEDLMRSNRMVKVVRSCNRREVYSTSKVLSDYIRTRIHSDDPASVWIAHRNGRTKNGDDRTEQGLLKMLSMSGSEDFVENMEELCIMPVSISYEIESCAVEKAFETYVKNIAGSYVKRPGEDLKSIITGIIQNKGRVHISFCEPISHSELEYCSKFANNERFRALAQIVDDRILAGYRIWPSNIVASEILLGKEPSNIYSVNSFSAYLEKQLRDLPMNVNRNEVRELLLAIYATPAIRKSEIEKDKTNN
ncbi:MAG: 1-acyl-sn-glycerol-3-phosphate acyltransferase [Bacteroidales bacterium]|nr:1-acyl-sn-glycerol-3-phosphate acyltransferase [Candidatus Cacconaster merdequi]